MKKALLFLLISGSMSLFAKESLDTCLAKSNTIPQTPAVSKNISVDENAKITLLSNIQEILAELRNNSNKALCYLKHISEKQD